MGKHYKTVLYLLKGQLIFFIAITICSLLVFNDQVRAGGVSYFGINSNSVILFSLALIATAWYSYKAGQAMPKTTAGKWVSRSLYIMALCLIGITITPFNTSDTVFAIHVGFGATLFFTQIALCFWLTFWYFRSRLNVVLFIVQLGGGIVSGLSLSDFLYVMFFGQLVSLLAFAILIVRHVGRLVSFRFATFRLKDILF